MIKYLLLLFSTTLLLSCQNNDKQQDKEKKESKPIPVVKQVPKKKAYYYTGALDMSEEYDESFQSLGNIKEYNGEITPIEIIEIYPSKKFMKVNFKGNEKIVSTSQVDFPIKTHQGKTVSIIQTNSYETPYRTSYLFLKDQKGAIHPIFESPTDEEEEEPSCLYLTYGKEHESKITSIEQKGDKLWLSIEQKMKDVIETTSYKIYQKDSEWWVDKKDSQSSIEPISVSEKSIEEIEDIALDKHLKAWNTESGRADIELVGEYIDYMKNVINKHPKSMRHPFNQLVGDRALETVTSEDNKLRFYSFNTEMGGTMVFYDALYQTNENGTIKTTDIKESEGDNGYFVSDIYTFKSKKETYYVVIENKIASNRDIAQIARAYTITNGKLQSIKLFTTEKKNYDEIPVHFDFFSAMDTHNERPIQVIRYDYDTQEFFIAMVDNDGNVGDKNLIYKWTGNEFEYTGIK